MLIDCTQGKRGACHLTSPTRNVSGTPLPLRLHPSHCASTRARHGTHKYEARKNLEPSARETTLKETKPRQFWPQK